MSASICNAVLSLMTRVFHLFSSSLLIFKNLSLPRYPEINFRRFFKYRAGLTANLGNSKVSH